ncbi:UDP-N-acetylglucosamine pyrophosphorylase [Penicillium oxalicum]|uniref:UDP-N-acetylglucosamine pyrophosphorylase n=1 Tax=Penicillium oxalicum TaxID=69781 RepID=UPI0020B6E480|nr:UDP-N-acetylglucosamine pyrophosphorylase [Penicillium oxalicum]KAI2792057.1 UDP-N-acetylglucosamine pyrophosphorylase [Penicillium oxalicum]
MAAIKDTVSNLINMITGSAEEAPREPSAEEFKDLQKKYTDAGQGQVFAFVDELQTVDKSRLFHQLSTFDVTRINELADKALNPPKTDETRRNPRAPPELRDRLDHRFGSHRSQGLGTRLGSSAPKGCFDIGLLSEKSLFQLQAERIVKLQQLASQAHGTQGAVIPWYVMTSGPTRKPTEEFFEKHKFFGLSKENVFIFEQGVLPCISNDGKIIMESKSKVAVAPDGNGGIYQAIVTSGVREDMRKRGIKHIHAYCVDNCLVKVADPVFIGFSASKKVDIATKVVRKRDAAESVGLILQKNGKPDVVEYSEIDQATAEAKDPQDAALLKFRAANIVNHYYSFDFFESIETWMHKLPHHIARKKIPYVDPESGEAVKPTSPNGVKLEQFVFDVFPMTPLDKFACIEVRREDEFSPLKNAAGTGQDDPDTSRADIMKQGQRWIEAAGGIVVTEGDKFGVEVSPLISYGGENLEFLQGREIKAPAIIEKEED